jgi:hypothetical protein
MRAPEPGEPNVQQPGGLAKRPLPPRYRAVTEARPLGRMITTDAGPHNTTGQAAEAAAPRLEAVMGQALPTQHPAVVLRSHYEQLRALLAVAVIAVVSLTAAVVVLATHDDSGAGSGAATQVSTPAPTGSTRYDGGPEEGSRAIAPAPAPNTRYDGGPEEGSRGALSAGAPSSEAPGTRYDGGPEEGQ